MAGDYGIGADPDGALARWASWQSSIRRRPVAALAGANGKPMWFAAGEVLLAEGEGRLAERFEALGATVVPEPHLPQPEAIARTRPLSSAVAPRHLRLRMTRPLPEAALGEGLSALAEVAGEKGGVAASSREAAAFAGLVVRHGSGRPGVGLNLFGEGDTLPLRVPQEGTQPGAGGPSPLSWPAYAQRARIVQAWQLLESYRLFRELSTPVWIAVMDGGFWVDGGGNPIGPSSDLPANVTRVNLISPGAPIGGPNPSTCTGSNPCPWHGNRTASVALGKVGNSLGAAGAGGTVGEPVLMLTDISMDQVVVGVRSCVRWGVDVLNMSFGFEEDSEWLFRWFGGEELWSQTFNYANGQGLIMVAAAGNRLGGGVSLPEDSNLRPATRTPGVITVGALDASDQARPDSNYGASISTWAPGTSIPAEPDPLSPSGAYHNGTSAAAPIVAGVAAMLRAIDPSIDSDGVLRRISGTGWKGTGRVISGLDAYAAVLGAMGGALPADPAELPTPAPLVRTAPSPSYSPGVLI